MNNREKGAASGLAITLIVVIVIAIIGIGFWWYHGANVSSDTVVTTTATPTSTSNAGYTYTIGSTTASTPNTGVETGSSASTNYNYNSTATTPAKTKTVTYTTYERKTVAAAASFNGVSGSTYHNSTYGLTLRLPSSGWSTFVTNGGPAGLPGTAQIHFVAPGESGDAFVINVWSKVGWNYVRTQENYVHLNTNNIGEGTYLGENFTWIYSYTINSHIAEAQGALSGSVFY